MTAFLARLFIKDHKNYKDAGVRTAYGLLCSALGIALNIVLFIGKYIAGVISGSIAITADSFNNLSDAGSSLISLLGFRLAARKPDPDHPFGHGRMEYLSGLAVALLIILMGFELGRDSVEKIINPSPTTPGILPAAILIASIAVKVYMSIYNRSIGKKINSSAMLATATDSLSDSVSTAVVLISMGVSYFFDINIDGYVGALVALLILWAGITAARDTISPLMGKAPEKEFVEEIERIVCAHEEICGIHDLLVHDYGPGRVVVSLHAEVDGSGDIYELHDVIDNIEFELKNALGCIAVVHMDPIDADNEELASMRLSITDLAREMDSRLSIHDLRVVPGTTHTNYIFDLLLPMDLGLSDEEAADKLKKRFAEENPGCFAVINVDRSYV